MNIILTGANGQVGREIQQHLPEELSHRVTLIPFSHQVLDISDPFAIQNMFVQYDPHLIINTAAFTAVDRAETTINEAFLVNAQGPYLIAEGCKKLNIPLIHLSTDYVFNGEKKSPYEEDDMPSPLNIYGQSKWQAEVTIKNQLEKYIILRTSWIFGYFGHNFVKTILKLAKQSIPLRIVADQIGSPTSAKSLAKVIWQIIHKISLGEISWGIYHYTDYPAVSWYDFAKTILCEVKHLNLEVNLISISTSDYPAPAKRPAYSVLNCQKLTNLFGIKQTSWQNELTSLIPKLLFDK